MCNRYELHYRLDAEYQALLGVQWPLDFASYNVCPTQSVPVIRTIEGERRGALVRWGLIPFFSKGEPGKFLTTNARIETVTTAASYRGAWKRGQRCLQLASGFYEWHTDASGRKAPFHITIVDQPLFAFASLWDHSVKLDGSVVESCVLVTMPGNALMFDIHNSGNNPHRMPAILRREDWDTWLTGSSDDAMAVLKQYPAELMMAYEVSTRVNSPKNNGPELIAPVRHRAPAAS